MTPDELRYALAKQVPDMAWRGVILETGYGRLCLDGRDAERVADLVRRLLEAQLRAAERSSARPER
jgi:hypothetical protein